MTCCQNGVQQSGDVRQPICDQSCGPVAATFVYIGLWHYRLVFKVSAVRLDIRAQTGAPLSDCLINNMLVKFTVTSHWDRRYTVKATVDNSSSTSRSIISCLGPEVFVQINRILTKFCPWKLGVPVIKTHRVQLYFHYRQNLSFRFCLTNKHFPVYSRLDHIIHRITFPDGCSMSVEWPLYCWTNLNSIKYDKMLKKSNKINWSNCHMKCTGFMTHGWWFKLHNEIHRSIMYKITSMTTVTRLHLKFDINQAILCSYM